MYHRIQGNAKLEKAIELAKSIGYVHDKEKTGLHMYSNS